MGILIYCNLALSIWVSKRQLTIENSVFGAEFIAMKHKIEALGALHYRLCMMGVPLTGPTFIYGDNKYQVTNAPTAVKTNNGVTISTGAPTRAGPDYFEIASRI